MYLQSIHMLAFGFELGLNAGWLSYTVGLVFDFYFEKWAYTRCGIRFLVLSYCTVCYFICKVVYSKYVLVFDFWIEATLQGILKM